MLDGCPRVGMVVSQAAVQRQPKVHRRAEGVTGGKARHGRRDGRGEVADDDIGQHNAVRIVRPPLLGADVLALQTRHQVVGIFVNGGNPAQLPVTRAVGGRSPSQAVVGADLGEDVEEAAERGAPAPAAAPAAGQRTVSAIARFGRAFTDHHADGQVAAGNIELRALRLVRATGPRTRGRC